MSESTFVDRHGNDRRRPRAPAGRKRRIAACIVVAVALHAAFLDGVAGWSSGGAAPSPAPLTVRTIALESAPDDLSADPSVAAAAPTVVATPPPPSRRPAPKRSRAPAATAPLHDEASAGLRPSQGVASSDAPNSPVAEVAAPASSGVASTPEREAADPDGETSNVAAVAASAATPAVAAAVAASAAASAADLSTLAGAGDRPPPTYRTSLPPAATLHYQVRRGFLRGEGEIRWQPAGDRYRLVLEARLAGLTLLVQTSEGTIESTGLAPERFLDQRARRSAQAANFVHGSGRVTWSGTTADAPLLGGAQDRLSWMVQLAGIAGANPELLVDGGRITMEVVGARGDAAIWTLRVAGREDVETADGTVRAVKLVRDGRSAYDTTAEIWLDPARAYLPAHATLRNSGGGSEYDLLLERIEP